jgi:hypothetical protein
MTASEKTNKQFFETIMSIISTIYNEVRINKENEN